jgi:hypothetical protein
MKLLFTLCFFAVSAMYRYILMLVTRLVLGQRSAFGIYVCATAMPNSYPFTPQQAAKLTPSWLAGPISSEGREKDARNFFSGIFSPSER